MVPLKDVIPIAFKTLFRMVLLFKSSTNDIAMVREFSRFVSAELDWLPPGATATVALVVYVCSYVSVTKT